MSDDSSTTREAFPLQWPDGFPRVVAAQRKTAQFQVSAAAARDDMLNDLRRMGAQDVVLSCNVRTAKDGFMSGAYREPADPGVAVYFRRMVGKGKLGTDADGYKAYAMACDGYKTVRSNLRALGLTVRALRTIERYGSHELMERAFTGFAALPPAGGGTRHWTEVLGVPGTASDDAIKAAFRALARVHHPDAGGDGESFARISRAYQEAQIERGFQ